MASLPLSEIHRRALLAASKVSLSFTAASIAAIVGAGCGGQLDDAPAHAHVGQDDAASPSDAAPAPDAASAAEASTAPDAASDASSCGAMVQAALGADAGVPTDPVDPALVKCCETILPDWTKDGDHGVGFEAARGCCSVLGVEEWWTVGSAACTPWGPPMPPEMPRAAAILEVA